MFDLQSSRISKVSPLVAAGGLLGDFSGFVALTGDLVDFFTGG